MFLEKVKRPHSNGEIVKNNPHVMAHTVLHSESGMLFKSEDSWLPIASFMTIYQRKTLLCESHYWSSCWHFDPPHVKNRYNPSVSELIFLLSDLWSYQVFFFIIYRTSILLEINPTTLQQMCQMMRFVPKGFRYWHPEHRGRAFYLTNSLFFIYLLGSSQYLSLFKWGNMKIYIWNMHIGEDGKL